MVEINQVVLEKKSFKGKKVDGPRTDRPRTLHHPISSAGLRPGELTNHWVLMHFNVTDIAKLY